MPVEVSFVQVMSLGALVATVLFLFFLLAVSVFVGVKAIKLFSAFMSVGAERVNGRLQMRGMFSDGEALGASARTASKPSALKAIARELVDFEPSAEDLQRQAEIEQSAAGAGGIPN